MKTALRITVNILLTLVILAHIIKGPGHDRASWYLTYALMFAAGARVMAWAIHHEINRRIREITRSS